MCPQQHGLQQRPVAGSEDGSLLHLHQSDSKRCRGVFTYPAQGPKSCAASI